MILSKHLLRARNAFWFDLSAYHNNDSAIVLCWGRQLPAICRGFLRCALEDQCQEFEIIMKRFVHEYLNKEYLEMVKRVFPNMSGDVNKEQSGPLQKWPVQKKGELLGAVGGAMVAFVIIVAAILMYRRRKMKKVAVTKPEPKITIHIPA